MGGPDIVHHQETSERVSVVEGKPELNHSEDGASSDKPQLGEDRVLVTDEDVSYVLILQAQFTGQEQQHKFHIFKYW